MNTALSGWSLSRAGHAPGCSVQLPARRPALRRLPSSWAPPSQNCRCRATQTETEDVKLGAKEEESSSANWLPALPPEELPKGTRKEVTIAGEAVLLFWYRNEIYAIEARSPAEGAYSEGFIKSKLTQNFGIECPSTSTVFSLKTGEILVWYPQNPVLRLLTPKDTCRKLSVYPVRLTQDAIEVDISSQVASGRSAKSLQQSKNDEVMALQPSEYIAGAEGEDVLDAAGRTANILAAAVAFVGTAGAGTAVAIYKQSTTGLYVFWGVYVVVVGLLVANYFRGNKEWL